MEYPPLLRDSGMADSDGDFRHESAIQLSAGSHAAIDVTSKIRVRVRHGFSRSRLRKVRDSTPVLEGGIKLAEATAGPGRSPHKSSDCASFRTVASDHLRTCALCSWQRHCDEIGSRDAHVR